jgi:3-oxoadipate enol-lactonase
MIADLPGVRLAYDDAGEGPPLVLLHGFPLDRTLWSPQRTALAAMARVVVPDLRGFGESTLGADPVTMDRYADDIVALLDHLGIERAVIGGLSMGGYVAFALWRRHPHRVRALALCDTRAGPDSAEARARRDLLIDQVRREGTAALVESQLPSVLGASTRAGRPEVVDLVRAMMARQPAAAVTAALGALRDRVDSVPTLATVTVPVLLLVGDEDTVTPPSEAEAMHAALPPSVAVQRQVIAGAGHLPCLERPAAVTRCLSDFLAALAASP